MQSGYFPCGLAEGCVSRASCTPWTWGGSLPPAQGFEMETLAGPAFAWVRQSLGLSEKDYQKALGPGDPYLQFVSNSRSKASFFLS